MSDFEKDDLFLKEQFQKSYQNIHLPDDLKCAVLSEMKSKAECEIENTENTTGSQEIKQTLEVVPSKKKSQKGKIKSWQYGTVAAVLCAAALIFIVLRPSGVSYITPMEDGIYYDTVELKNGKIHFVKNRVAISISPNAGQIVIGGDSVVGNEEEEKTMVLEEITSESGGELLFQETEQIALPEIAKDNWSNIGEQEMYVTVLKTEDVRYQAVFEKDGMAYEVVGIDVTQKEFIDYLYSKIKE